MASSHGARMQPGAADVRRVPLHHPCRLSDITESNGSSSMASVCGTSLATDGRRRSAEEVRWRASRWASSSKASDYAILSDILGDEDHLGDMDFKVAGTADGITTLQMDIKIAGITREIIEVALRSRPRAAARTSSAKWRRRWATARVRAVGEFAPRIETIQIDKTKIRDSHRHRRQGDPRDRRDHRRQDRHRRRRL
jgi:polyribonucleotide nucleotidyltransferase